MDPNANLAEQEALLARITLAGWSADETEEDRRVLREKRVALAQWRSKRGFEPDWSKAPNARKYYGR